MVKHHDVVGRYVTIEVDDCEYKVFYLQNGKGIPLICQHTAGCHNHQWRGLLEDEEIINSWRSLCSLLIPSQRTCRFTHCAQYRNCSWYFD